MKKFLLIFAVILISSNSAIFALTGDLKKEEVFLVRHTQNIYIQEFAENRTILANERDETGKDFYFDDGSGFELLLFIFMLTFTASLVLLNLLRNNPRLRESRRFN